MKTLLSRSTVSPAKLSGLPEKLIGSPAKLLGATLITATLSMPAMAKDADLESLIEAAQRGGLQCGYARQLGKLERHMDGPESKLRFEASGYGHELGTRDPKFEAEKRNATADIGDVGFAFARVAVKKDVTQPYKPTTWNDIPDWAKDKDGHWALAYTGTISFISNNNLVEDAPKSWSDLLEGDYKVTVGDVGVAAQANNAILAAAFANGGDESNLKPAIKFFGELAKQGRLSYTDPSIANLEKAKWKSRSCGTLTH